MQRPDSSGVVGDGGRREINRGTWEARRGGLLAQRRVGKHNRVGGPGRESEGLIVARKRGNALPDSCFCERRREPLGCVALHYGRRVGRTGATFGGSPGRPVAETCSSETEAGPERQAREPATFPAIGRDDLLCPLPATGLGDAVRSRRATPCACRRRENPGPPDAGNPHVRWDEGGGSRPRACSSPTLP